MLLIEYTQLLEKNVNQWRKTDAVVTWFQNIENKGISSFIKFDIVNFYPSISTDLLVNVYPSVLKDLLINTMQFSKLLKLYYMPTNRYYSTKMRSGLKKTILILM